ncbi:hypothetical protein TNCV_836031 [Trichonephila clavipes]|nr:hypothetical protein TNCV_836031 [Trichonephila clavipes]
MTRRGVENREGSLGYPRFVTVPQTEKHGKRSMRQKSLGISGLDGREGGFFIYRLSNNYGEDETKFDETSEDEYAELIILSNTS